jgi:hypothetical protein
MKPQLSCTRSGYITCPVCNSTRYYTTLQRRYGQFTCVACYRFFKEFFLHPKRFECPTLTQCPLNVKNKCRACWITACTRVYSVDPKRDSILAANRPIRTDAEDAKEKMSELDQCLSTVASVATEDTMSQNATRPTSPLTLESQNDLMSSAIILQQFLEQSNRLKQCLQVQQSNDAHSGQSNHATNAEDNSNICERVSDSPHNLEHPNFEQMSIIDERIGGPFNSNSNDVSPNDEDRTMLYPTGLSGVAAVAAAAAAVENATARQQEQQQQRLNEALCAEMLMKLESVAAQQQQHHHQKTETPDVDQQDELSSSEFMENSKKLSKMTSFDMSEDKSDRMSPSRSPGNTENATNEQIETLENSMFVNLLPDLESIGITSGQSRNKEDAGPVEAVEMKNQNGKRRRKSKSNVSVESDFAPVMKKSKARVKNWCCLKCPNCLADDCGKCINCLDRPKFGGPFIRKQRCINKRCLMKGSKAERSNGPMSTIIISSTPIPTCDTSSLNAFDGRCAEDAPIIMNND